MTYALLFDFDGVLVDSTPAYRAAWSEWARTYRANEAFIWADAHGRRPDDIIRRVAPRVDFSEALLTFDLLPFGPILFQAGVAAAMYPVVAIPLTLAHRSIADPDLA